MSCGRRGVPRGAVGRVRGACGDGIAVQAKGLADGALYFQREKGMLGALGGTAPAAEVKVDDKVVGSVTNGSYLFVDRPPGVHKLYVRGGLTLAGFETKVQVVAGKEYYFNIGVPRTGAPGTDLLNELYAGGKGEQMRPESVLAAGMSGTAFYSLDPATGAAEIARLKVPR
jgi:Protein of unknown function (DUF2846)